MSPNQNRPGGRLRALCRCVTRGFSILSALAFLLPAVFAPTEARAQDGTPNSWCTVVAAGTVACFGTPLQACYKQWQVYNGIGTFQGFSETTDVNHNPIWYIKTCHWPAPPGSGPSTVKFICPDGLSPNDDLPVLGTCNGEIPPPPKCDPCGNQNSGGDPAVRTPRPIDILSGNKQFVVKDFDNASGSLSLNRVFNSMAYSGALTPPNDRPLGLANWLYDFQFELQIGSGWTSSGGNLSVMTPSGVALGFSYNGPSLTLTPLTNGNPQTNFTLAYAGGTWPSDLRTLTAASTTWTLRDSDDTVWTLQTFEDPGTSTYITGKPVTMTRRNGLTWTFAYGTSNQLSSITDPFGNEITFDWLTNSFSGLPWAISQAHLPGSYSIKYSYAAVGPSTGVAQPDVLSQVQYLDSGSVVQDQTTYKYGNAAFPYSVTEVDDANGVQRWGVSYESTHGYATTSSLNGSASAAMATGSITGSTMTVAALASGAFAVGQNVTGTGVALGTVISALGTGTGGAGTYTVGPSQTVGSITLTSLPISATATGSIAPNAAVFTGSISGTTLVVSSHSSGTVGVGQVVTGTGVAAGTVITTSIGVDHWVVSPSQTVTSTTMTSLPSVAVITGSISTTTMTVSALTSGTLMVGEIVNGPGVTAGTTITALGTGSGGSGTYTVSPSQTAASTTLTSTGGTLTVAGITSGALAVGQSVTGTGAAAGTVIAALGSGSTGIGSYTVNIPQTVSSTTLTTLPNTTSNSAVVTGSISGTTMTVTGVTGGALSVGQSVTGGSGAGVAGGTVISALGTGAGGPGTYTVNISQTVGSTTLWAFPNAAVTTASISATTMTVTGVTSGALAVGQSVTGAGVTAGTVITGLVTGTGGTGAYAVNPSQTVSSTTLISSANPVQSYQIAYTPAPAAGSSFTRTVTNPLGKVSIYTYLNSTSQGFQLTGVANQASLLSPASSKTYAYGSDGFVSSLTDENGNLETFETSSRDPRGMPTQTVEASGTASARTTNTTWNSTWHEPASVAQTTVSTTFVYNSAGAPKSKTQTDNTTFTVPYSTNGRSRTWNYVWNSSGQLMAVHGPRWVSPNTVDTTAFTYNANGYLQTIANALGQTTTVTAWDWRGAPLSVTDPNGVITTFTYDIHGRLLTATANPGAVQSQYQFAYDAVGDISQVTLPGGATLTYTNDQGRRVTLVQNVRGETQAFAYDSDDDPLSVVTESASSATTQTHTGNYDEWGRIIQSIGGTTPSTHIWALAYDNLDNLTSITDPLSHERQNAYDPLNRVKTQTDPALKTVQFAYDALDNLNQLTDSRSLATAREVDGFGEVIQEVSPDRGTRSYWYDLSSNLTKLVDGDSVETDFVYDDANRRTSTTFPSDSTENIGFTYDQTSGGNYGVGRLTNVTEASGSTGFAYDAQGRMITDSKVINLSGYTTPFVVSYVYDANGKVIQITYPSGDVVNVTRSTDGLVKKVTETPSGGAQENIAVDVTYEPFGPLASLTYGNGLNLTRSYDKDYRLKETTVAPTSGAAVLDLGFSWRLDDRVLGVSDNAGTGRGASFAYATTGRVVTATGPWGTQVYDYDASGNRIHVGPTSATYVRSIISPTSNQVTRTTDQSGVTQRTLAWRAGGDLFQDSHVGGTLFEYDYNAAKRVVEVQQNGSQAGGYAYDFAGRRVWRQTFGTGAAQTAYIYDPQGHLLAEHKATTGVAAREYIWIDDEPVALLDISGGTVTTDFIHTGQIGEPLAVTSSTQALVWNAYVDPFGTATNIGTPTTQLHLRLPGQWLQVETDGLHQNGYRDYDPSLARYIEGDPLGINAGQNIYAYVDGDPLNLTDPAGLACTSGTGVTVCSTPGGPTFAVRTPKNFPSYLGPEDLLYHLYVVGRSLGCASPADVFRAMVNNPTPGSSSPASPNGTPNDAQIALFSNPVTSYLTNDLVTGVPLVVNITGSGSFLSPGYVARYVSRGVAITMGEGLSPIQSPIFTGQTVQDLLAEGLWGSQMANFIAESRCICTR